MSQRGTGGCVLRTSRTRITFVMSTRQEQSTTTMLGTRMGSPPIVCKARNKVSQKGRNQRKYTRNYYPDLRK